MVLDMDTLYRIYSNEHSRYVTVRAHQHRHRPAPTPPRKRAGDDRFLANSEQMYLVHLEGRTLHTHISIDNNLTIIISKFQ